MIDITTDRGGSGRAYVFGYTPLTLRPLVASEWSQMKRIGGGYSYALPGHASARQALARPFDNRVFFAGEATSAGDFSTAHGAHDSGVRAADEALATLGS